MTFKTENNRRCADLRPTPIQSAVSQFYCPQNGGERMKEDTDWTGGLQGSEFQKICLVYHNFAFLFYSYEGAEDQSGLVAPCQSGSTAAD